MCLCVCTFCIEVKLHRVFYCISISRGPLGNIAVSGQRRRCNISAQTYLQRARTQAHGSAPGRRRAQLGGTGNFQSNCYGLTLKKLLVCTFKVLSEQTLLLNLNKCVFCNRSPTRWLQPHRRNVPKGTRRRLFDLITEFTL